MSDDYALLTAIRHRDISAATALLREKRVDVNACDDSGRTPLHLAVEDEVLLPVVEELLRCGATVNLPNAHGNTPLHRAAKHGHVDIAMALLHHGANPQLRNGRGETAAESSKTVQLRDALLQGAEEEASSAEAIEAAAGPPDVEAAAPSAAAVAAAEAAERRRREKARAAKVGLLPAPPRALNSECERGRAVA